MYTLIKQWGRLRQMGEMYVILVDWHLDSRIQRCILMKFFAPKWSDAVTGVALLGPNPVWLRGSYIF